MDYGNTDIPCFKPLTNSDIDGATISGKMQKGVRSEPLFKSILLSHYIHLILHITIGKGNDVLYNLIKEMQAAAEAYSTPAYTEAGKTCEVRKLQHMKCANKSFPCSTSTIMIT